jgi:hypothetical protein
MNYYSVILSDEILPIYESVEVCSLLIYFDLAIAFAAVYRPILTWLERYFTVFTAFGTDCLEHLPSLPEPTSTKTIRPSGLAACGATLWFIGIAFRRKELLFSCAKGEAGSAIGAFD